MISKMNNHLSPQSLNIRKTTTYDVGNPGPDIGQGEAECGVVGLWMTINSNMANKATKSFL